MKRLSTTLVFILVPSVLGAADLNLTPRGVSGLIDMPDAFMLPDAESALSIARDKHLSTLNFTFQALPRLQTSLSFATYDDIGAGVSSENTSLNLKYALTDEGRVLPAISVGINGLFGNDRDAAEYIVASKTLAQTVEASVGLGWGRYGGTADVSAPFGQRPAFDTAKRASFDHLFKGDAGVFAGLLWHTPVDGLSLAAEYSSDTFANEALMPDSRFNFGARYEVSEGLTLGAYQRGGDTVGVTLTLSGNPNRPRVAQPVGAPPVFVGARSGAAQTWGSAASPDFDRLAGLLSEQGIQLQKAKLDGDVAAVRVVSWSNAAVPKVIGRTARVLAATSPQSVNVFDISLTLNDLPTKTFTIRRNDIHQLVDQPRGGSQVLANTGITGASDRAQTWDWQQQQQPGFYWSVAPRIQLDVTSDNEFDPVAVLNAFVKYTVSPSLSFVGVLDYLLAGDKNQDPAPALPTARSDNSSYDRSSVQFTQLAAVYQRKLSDTVYSRFSFGLLERGYGGASAEILWTPNASNLAFGIEVNEVKKRDYDDPFEFVDYTATTGHGSVYWDTGYKGVSAQLDVGKYLAGDWGGTVTLSRYHANGWDTSLSATLTEANKDEQLKLGLRVSIPLGWVAPTTTAQKSTLRLGGISGDAGARLNVSDRLYPKVRDAGDQRVYDSWGEFWK